MILTRAYIWSPISYKTQVRDFCHALLPLKKYPSALNSVQYLIGDDLIQVLLKQQRHLSPSAPKIGHRYVQRHYRQPGKRTAPGDVLSQAAEAGEDANEGQLKVISQVGKMVRIFAVLFWNDKLAGRHVVLPRKVLERDFGRNCRKNWYLNFDGEAWWQLSLHELT